MTVLMEERPTNAQSRSDCANAATSELPQGSVEDLIDNHDAHATPPQLQPQPQQRTDGDVQPHGLNEWADVSYTPIPDGEVLSLEPTERFTHLFSVLYAMEERDELSVRALRLTTDAIKLNMSNPTAWMYRHRIIQSLARDDEAVWHRELAFTASLLRDSRKNYQAWQHRRYCVDRAAMHGLETQFVDVVLEHDAKNYHAWAHRAWLVRSGVVAGELDATEWMLRTDVRNNSAWNHRWVVGAHTGRTAEVGFACNMVPLAPRNESVWNFLLALARAGEDVAQARRLATDCLRDDDGCKAARRFLVLTAREDEAADVVEQCRSLANGPDNVRYRYWTMQQEHATKLLHRR